MNKYQELKEWLEEINTRTEWNKCSIEEPAMTQINELLQKATPKKGYMKAMEGFDADVASHLVCPSCEQPIVNVWTSRKYEPKYCHYCGQALDWGDQ